MGVFGGSGKGVRIEAYLDADGVVRGLKRIDGGIDRTERNVAQSGGSMKRIFENAFGYVTGIGITQMVAALGRAAWATTQVGVAANETQNRYNTVFKEGVSQLEAYREEWARVMGMTDNEFKDLAAQVGSLFASVDVAGEALVDNTETVIMLAADLASSYDKTIQESFLAIRSGLAGESEPLKNYAVFLNEAAVQQRALAMAGKESAKELTNQDKVLARLALTMEGASKSGAAGDFIRTQNEIANRQRAIAAEFRQTQETLGVTLLPAYGMLLDLIAGLTEGSDGLTRSFIVLVSDGLLEAVGVVGELLISFSHLVDAVGLFTAGAEDAGVTVSDVLLFPIRAINTELDALATKIEWLVKLPKLVRRAGVAANLDAAESLGWTSQAEKLRAELQKIDLELDAFDRKADARKDRRSDLEDQMEQRRAQLRDLIANLDETVAASRERKKQLQAVLDGLGDTKTTSGASYADFLEDYQRQAEAQRIEAMEEGVAKQLAQIEDEFQQKKAKLKDEYGALAGLMIELAEEARDRAVLDAARMPVIVDIKTPQEMREMMDELAADAERELVASLEALPDIVGRTVGEYEDEIARLRSSIQHADDADEVGGIQERIRLLEQERDAVLGVTEALSDQERIRVAQAQAAFSSANAQIESAEDVLAHVLNQVRQEIKAYMAATVAKALASVPFPLNVALGAAAGAAFELAIPSFRSGVTNFEGGLAKVHSGELLVNMAAGTNVITNENTNALMGAINSVGQHRGEATSGGVDLRPLLDEIRALRTATMESKPVAFLDDLDRALTQRDQYRKAVRINREET